MEKIIDPVPVELLKAELTPEKKLRNTNKGGNVIYIVDAHDSPNVMREIGRLREESFRQAGGSSGLEADIDEFDTMPNPYKQIVVWDPDAEAILGGYRYIMGPDVRLDDKGQPTNTYVSFKDSKIAEAARVFSMPFNVAVGNSSSYNYASGRLDHQVYHRKLKIERETMGCRILDPIFAEWQEMDRLIHPADYVGADDTSHTWMWDGFEHVDPVKEANAAATRLAIGLTSLSEECALEGKDVETVTARRQREIQDYQQRGLPPLPWMSGGASQANSKQASDEDKE